MVCIASSMVVARICKKKSTTAELGRTKESFWPRTKERICLGVVSRLFSTSFSQCPHAHTLPMVHRHVDHFMRRWDVCARARAVEWARLASSRGLPRGACGPLHGILWHALASSASDHRSRESVVTSQVPLSDLSVKHRVYS